MLLLLYFFCLSILASRIKNNMHIIVGSNVTTFTGFYGSCVLKASVDRVSVDTLGRHVGRVSADISTDTRSICRPSVGRHVVQVNRLSVDTIGRYVGRHSADTSVDMLRSTVAGVSVDCR